MNRVRRWLGARVRPRSLRDTMVSVLTLAGIGSAVALTAMLAFVISPGFAELEERATAGYHHRLQTVLAEFPETMEGIAREYAQSAASDRARDAWARSVFAAHAVDAVAYRPVSAKDWAMRAGSGMEWNGQDSTAVRLAEALNRIDLARTGSRAGFYLPVGGEVMALGLAAVMDRNGRTIGHVAMARRLTAVHLSDVLGRAARIDQSATAGTDIVRRHAGVIDIASPIRSADGRPIATATLRVSREVVLLGRRVLLLAVAGSILLLVFMLLMLRRALGSLVLAPLGRVERHMRRVQASGALLPFEDGGRGDDEFGALGRSFNAMLSQLKDLREQNEIQSFALGRSESAVAVLHNVRNALAPLGTILSVGLTPEDRGDRILMDRALAELARDDIAPERRAKLVSFLRTALDAEAMARDAVRGQLELGRDAMRQTLEIIGAQQARAHERPGRERCDITDIIARNATIARYAQSVSIGFTFPAHSAYVLANRVILSQVIGNLLSNAVEAIVATGRGYGSILVEILPPVDGRIATRIIDDGEGFEPGMVTQLFLPGFSTRTDKSGGLGLHWCANSMAAMGGTLELRSAGRGTGAVAILTLDLDRSDREKAGLAA